MDNENNNQEKLNKKDEEKEEKVADEKDDVVILSYKLIWTMFGLIVCTMIFPSIDGGVIPASNNQMMKDMHISESQYGLFSTFGTIGSLVGALVISTFIGKYNRKYLLPFILMIFSL